MILFWLGIAIIIIWILAKKAGLFNTPLIIEVIPYFGGLVTILAVVKEFGKMINKLDNVVLDVKDIKIEIKDIRTDIHSLDKRVLILDGRVAVLESRI